MRAFQCRHLLYRFAGSASSCRESIFSKENRLVKMNEQIADVVFAELQEHCRLQHGWVCAS